MSDYRVATGYGASLDDMTVISPQPQCDGVQYAKRIYAVSGTVLEEGPYVEFVWEVLEDEDEYQDLLQLFNVKTNSTAPVTIYVRDETWAYVRMNGVAVRPEAGRERRWQNYFPRNITLLVRDLERLTGES